MKAKSATWRSPIAIAARCSGGFASLRFENRFAQYTEFAFSHQDLATPAQDELGVLVALLCAGLQRFNLVEIDDDVATIVVKLSLHPTGFVAHCYSSLDHGAMGAPDGIGGAFLNVDRLLIADLPCV